MQKVLIIGASRGIGLALVQQYLAAGCQVFASARQDVDCVALSALGAQSFICDVDNAEHCAALAQRFAEQSLDIAILNAGVMGPRTIGFEVPSAEDFHQVMHTNVLAAMRFLPVLAQVLKNPQARLAVLSSRMGSLTLRESAGCSLYRASKAALNSVLLDVALSYPALISVALHPGWVRTDMGGTGAMLAPEQSAAGIRTTLSQLQIADTGSFYNYDGSLVAW